MYNWLTRTWQGQIVSFLVVLFLIGSYAGIFHSAEQEATQEAKKQKKPPEPAPPVPSPPAPSKEPAAEPAAPKPEPTPEPAATLEKLINELGSAIKTQAAKAQDKLAELEKPAVKELIESLYSLNKEARIQAGWALIRIGEHSVQPLLDELAVCEDKDAQCLIKCILSHIGPAIGPLKKIRGNARLQEAAKEILAEIEKDKLSQSDAVPSDAASEALQTYERILAEHRDAAKKLRKARTDLQTAARAALLKRSESWRKRALDLRTEIEAGEKALAELDRQVKSAREKIPEPPS